MQIDSRTVRTVLIIGLFMGLMAAGTLLTSGPLKIALFLMVAIAGIGLSIAVWPEIVVMAYLFAGRYGYEARLAPGDIPVSLNQVMLIGLVVLAFLHRRHVLKIIRTWSFLALMLFGLALLLGLAWTLGINYGLYKVSRTWLVVVPGISIALALIEARRSVIPLAAAAFLIGFALNSAGLLTFESSMSETNRLSALGSGPNVFARTVGFSLLITLLAMIWTFQQGLRTWTARIFMLVLAAAFLWLLAGFAFAQSRGPVLAFLAAVAVIVTLSLYGNWRTVILGIGALVFSFWTGSALVQAVLGGTRFDIRTESNFVSMNARVDLLWSTWELVFVHPLLGVGTGAWPVHVFGIDERSYPHNFFAEIAVENGVFLAALLAVMFALVIGRGLFAWLTAPDPFSRFLLMGSLTCFVFFMLNVSVTGDTVDNRLIWLTLGAVESCTALATQRLTQMRRARAASAIVPAPSSVAPPGPHR